MLLKRLNRNRNVIITNGPHKKWKHVTKFMAQPCARFAGFDGAKTWHTNHFMCTGFTSVILTVHVIPCTNFC